MGPKDLQRILPSFVGGQLEITNRMEDYLYRGEIESVTVVPGDGPANPGEVKVKFKWLAKFTDQATWQNDTQLDYGVSLLLASFSLGSGNRVHYSVSIVWESGTFFPPSDDELDPSKVEGLVLA